MFKNSLSILLIVFIGFFSTSQEIRESPVLGNVKFILEESFEGSFDGITYRKNGKNRQVSWMNDNKMEFDEKKNLIKRSFYDDERIFIHAEEYQYNNSQLILKKYLSFIYSYAYDGNGNKMIEFVAPMTDSLNKKIKHRYAYNKLNQLTDIWELDFKGGNVCHQTNQYTSTGKLAKETFEYQDGKEYIKYLYDVHGRMIKKEWYDFQEGLLERTTYTYHGNGNLATEFWESINKSKVESTTKYVFDHFGNVKSSWDLDPKRQISDHEINTYDFDDQNNWTKKITAINNSRFYIVERTITYY